MVKRASRGSLSFGAVRNKSLDHHLISVSSSITIKGLEDKECVYIPASATNEAELRQRVVVCHVFLVPCLW